MEPNFEMMDLSPDTGTTVMAFEYDGGVVIGSDSRTSAGQYTVNRYADKLTRVTDKIYCCRSGSAADTQAITDIVSYILYYNEISWGKESLVATAAREFRNVIYKNRDNLLAGIIVAGWDEELGGQVYTVGLGGLVKRCPVVLGGSGSVYITGLIGELYRPNLSKEECVELAQKALKQATISDTVSGGVMRIGVITEKGIEYNVFDCSGKDK